eukprot:m.189192 g.189192  ORF g.189192 m.189192 type:complete len:406 (-) comp24850_c0_seq7:724-1941(-)
MVFGGREGTFITPVATRAVRTELLPKHEAFVGTAQCPLTDAARQTLQDGGTITITPKWLDPADSTEFSKVALQLRRVDTSGRGASDTPVVFTDAAGSRASSSQESTLHNFLKTKKESTNVVTTDVQAAFRDLQTRAGLNVHHTSDFPMVDEDGSASARALYRIMSSEQKGMIDILSLDPSAQWSLFEAPHALLGMSPPRTCTDTPTPLPQIFVNPNDKVKVNQQQFGAIVSNLEHRQAHITRLQSQIDVSSNTIRDQVKDIVTLRENVAELKEEGSTLAQELAQHKEALGKTLRQEGVVGLPRRALVEGYSQVSQRFQQEEARQKEYVDWRECISLIGECTASGRIASKTSGSRSMIQSENILPFGRSTSVCVATFKSSRIMRPVARLWRRRSRGRKRSSSGLRR